MFVLFLSDGQNIRAQRGNKPRFETKPNPNQAEPFANFLNRPQTKPNQAKPNRGNTMTHKCNVDGQFLFRTHTFSVSRHSCITPSTSTSAGSKISGNFPSHIACQIPTFPVAKALWLKLKPDNPLLLPFVLHTILFTRTITRLRTQYGCLGSQSLC